MELKRTSSLAEFLDDLKDGSEVLYINLIDKAEENPEVLNFGVMAENFRQTLNDEEISKKIKAAKSFVTISSSTMFIELHDFEWEWARKARIINKCLKRLENNEEKLESTPIQKEEKPKKKRSSNILDDDINVAVAAFDKKNLNSMVEVDVIRTRDKNLIKEFINNNLAVWSLKHFFDVEIKVLYDFKDESELDDLTQWSTIKELAEAGVIEA